MLETVDSHPSIVVAERKRRELHQSIDLEVTADTAFAALREVEKWPVWLSFLRSVKVLSGRTVGLGTEVAVRSAIPGEEEELFEVDRYIDGHLLSLVGFYSCRRRFEFRVERRVERSRIQARLDYPAYGGLVGALVDRLTARRRLGEALGESLIHFKGLVEYDAP